MPTVAVNIRHIGNTGPDIIGWIW